MTRLRWLLAAALGGALAGCAPHAPRVTGPGQPAACRIGPDGGPPVAATDRQTADRGIGGTGAPVRQAERGIGGTGIVGVITGFGSVCVAGREVALDSDTPTEMDGLAATPADLRAGQVVALVAAGTPDRLAAERLGVRHAVIGPVTASSPGFMTVAGQLVLTVNAMGQSKQAQAGQWVSVSGLGGTGAAGGAILATRIDPAAPGTVLVRGALTPMLAESRIGPLIVDAPASAARLQGSMVVATGHLRGNVLVADTVEPDPVAESPARAFGAGVTRFVIEAPVADAAGGYVIGHDFVASHGGGAAGSHGFGILTFDRAPDGGFIGTGLSLEGLPGSLGPPGSLGALPVPMPPGGATALPGGLPAAAIAGPPPGFGASGHLGIPGAGPGFLPPGSLPAPRGLALPPGAGPAGHH